MEVNGQLRSDQSTEKEDDALHAAAQSELADRRAFSAPADISHWVKGPRSAWVAGTADVPQ
jgi:hypothetical protein